MVNLQIPAQKYELLFATLSGAHMYGFPSVDSDYDIRGVHILPPEKVLGLIKGKETIEFSGIYEGKEIDLVTHDIKKFLNLLLNKNGNALEQLYSKHVLESNEFHEELKILAKKNHNKILLLSLQRFCYISMEKV